MSRFSNTKDTPIEFRTQRSQTGTHYRESGLVQWRHRVVLEGILLQNKEAKYPKCTGGQRACPPEDCGGIPGYYNLIEVLEDTNHNEHEEMVYWLSNHARNYHPYNSEQFEPNKVLFHDPKKRLEAMFTSGEQD